MRLATRITYSDGSLCDTDSWCSTVATSSELVATVDHDGHRINSARARTPHEPLSSVLMRFAYSSRAVAITLTSAHRQRVGRRPAPPLNPATPAVKAGACAHFCKIRTLSIFCVERSLGAQPASGSLAAACLQRSRDVPSITSSMCSSRRPSRHRRDHS